MSSVVTPSAPPAPPPPPLPPVQEPPRRRWWLARRVLLGGLGVVLLSGGATAVLALNEVSKVVEALRQSRQVKLAPDVLAPTSRGSAETLLLVGNDERPPPKGNPFGKVLPHSNEMLLVRIDPSKPTISMLSIPRELQVTFTTPTGQVVTNRINSAYTYGGIELMTRTIKRLLGISVNHVFVVTFPKFRRAVDEMGCVYMTVDRRYYHVNEPGGEQYSEINLQPGYQRMCGREALEFVANRHEDTSLTRDARDQRFLLEAKAQYGGSLFEDREKFERILGKAVETDVHESSQVLDLLALLVESQGKPVRQVPFQVTLLPTYDLATPQQIQTSVSSFLGGTAPIPKYRLSQSLRSVHSHSHGRPPLPTLAPTEGAAIVNARSLAPSLPFALEYPRFRHPYAAAEPDTLRPYDIRDPQGRLHPSYVIVVQAGSLGSYYDIEGSSWTEPPLLNDPSQEIRVGARTYELFYEGEQMRAVGWREGNAAYWVQNTLRNELSPREMLAIAEQTVPVVSAASARPAGALSLRRVTLPSRATPTAGTATKVGAALGFAGLGALALLAWHVLSRARELGRLREQVSQAIGLEARQRTLLATAAAGPAAPSPALPTAASMPATPSPAAAASSAAAPAGLASAGAVGTRAIYRARPRPRAALVVGAGVLAAGAIAAALLASSPGSSSPAPGAEPLAVAVLDAGHDSGAARRLAASLRAAHEHVTRVGETARSGLGAGTYVLYPSGARRQAGRIAQLIAGPRPRIAPLPQHLRSALADHGEIVIVIG